MWHPKHSLSLATGLLHHLALLTTIHLHQGVCSFLLSLLDEFQSDLDLVIEPSVGSHSLVQLSVLEVDQHASYFGSFVQTSEFLNSLVDSVADQFTLVLLGSILELRGLEHGHDQLLIGLLLLGSGKGFLRRGLGGKLSLGV